MTECPGNSEEWRTPKTIGRRLPRRYYIMAGTAIGVCGELIVPFLFAHGFGLDGVITFQLVFFGVIMSVFYVAMDELPLKGGETQPTGERKISPRERRIENANCALAVVFFAFGLPLWMWAVYSMYGLLSYFPDDTVDYALSLLADVSFMAGAFLIFTTMGLHEAHRMRKRGFAGICLVTLALIGLLWVISEYVAYGLLSDYMEFSDHFVASRRASLGLLASSVLMSLGLFLVAYVSRPKHDEPVLIPEAPARTEDTSFR